MGSRTPLYDAHVKPAARFSRLGYVEPWPQIEEHHASPSLRMSTYRT